MAPVRKARMPARPTSQAIHLPAPVGGLNTVSAGTAMPATDAVQAYNLVAAEYGLRSRFGSREWAIGLTGASDNIVRTMLPFYGPAGSGANDRLFVTTSSGIWEVTDSGVVIEGDWQPDTVYGAGQFVNNDVTLYICITGGMSDTVGGPTGTDEYIIDGSCVWRYVGLTASYPQPTLAIAFSSTAGDAGYGVCHAMVTVAGSFLLYCDEVNGYYVYTQTTDTWAKVAMGGGAGEVSVVDPANLAFVTVWKSRVWFIEKDTANAWYLDAGAIYGAATKLPVGTSAYSAQARAGGPLVGLWSWTLDAGSGIDDHLVAVNAGGDLAVYVGTDPDTADAFGLKGVWSLGAIPAGRNIATRLGGDLLILTKSGIRQLSQLVTGGDGANQYATAKVSNLFNSLMLSRSSLKGWSMVLHPEDNSLVVLVPTVDGANTEQLAMQLWNRSWSRYRDLPIFSACVFGGKLYYGTVDGKVGVNDGYVDGITLLDPSSYTPVQWAGLSAFQNFGNGRQKRVQGIRATVLSEDNQPQFEVDARFGFDFTEIASVSGVNGGGNVWGSGVWDTAVWAGEFSPTQQVRGASGMGVDVAIAFRGTAVSRTVVVAFDVMLEQGGLL
jgi:hypothetical protein